MRPQVIAIGGTDSSGGAGLSRDLTTLAEMGVQGLTVVTAVTAQTNQKVFHVEYMSADFVGAQLECALQAKNVGAIKIGMLGNADIVEVVSRTLVGYQHIPIILDPVIASSSGMRLLSADGEQVLKAKLFPLCHLITPNLVESAMLTEHTFSELEDDLVAQASQFHVYGVANVLIKGGHGTGIYSIDRLFNAPTSFVRLPQKRIMKNMRGTGCLLASAIAGGLAKGLEILSAVKQAQSLVSAAILEFGVATHSTWQTVPQNQS